MPSRWLRWECSCGIGQASGRTALLTTHSAEVGQAWADRALTLAGGRIESDVAVSDEDRAEGGMVQ